MKITDTYILEKCFDKTHRIRSSIYKSLETSNYSDIKKYLEYRYKDIPENMFSYKEVLFRIKHNLDTRPVCQICNSPVQFIGKNPGNAYPTYYKATCCKEHERLLAKQHETETLQDKYGVSHIFCRSDIKEKSEKNRNSEEAKKKRMNTMTEKYGYPYAFMSPESRNKAQISLSKYRKEHPDKFETNTRRSIEYLKMLDILQSGNYDLEHYRNIPEFKNYVESYELTVKSNNKNFETRYQNQTLNSSNPENELFDILKNEWPDIIRNYSDTRYNFKCDFYIQELDLFIEYQGSFFHNKKPYTIEHDTELNNIIRKNESLKNITGKKLTAYDNLILTWTKRDVLKRNTAKSNKLNYLEIYPKYSLKDIPKFIKENYQKDTADTQIIIGT